MVRSSLAGAFPCQWRTEPNRPLPQGGPFAFFNQDFPVEAIVLVIDGGGLVEGIKGE
jgi:hypothetical protein